MKQLVRLFVRWLIVVFLVLDLMLGLAILWKC